MPSCLLRDMVHGTPCLSLTRRTDRSDRSRSTVDQIDHDLDQIDQIDHDLDQIDHDLDQIDQIDQIDKIDHDLDHLDLNLPGYEMLCRICTAQTQRRKHVQGTCSLPIRLHPAT